MGKDHPKPHQVPPSEIKLKQPRKLLLPKDTKNQPQKVSRSFAFNLCLVVATQSRKYHKNQFSKAKDKQAQTKETWRSGWDEKGMHWECAATPSPFHLEPFLSTSHRKIRFINVNVWFVKVRSAFAVPRVGGKQIHLRSGHGGTAVTLKRGAAEPLPR